MDVDIVVVVFVENLVFVGDDEFEGVSFGWVEIEIESFVDLCVIDFFW